MSGERVGFRAVECYLELLRETVTWARMHGVRGGWAPLHRRLAGLSARVDADRDAGNEDPRRGALTELMAWVDVMKEVFEPDVMAEVAGSFDDDLEGTLDGLLDACKAEIQGLPVWESRAAAELEAAFGSSVQAFGESLKFLDLREALSTAEDLCSLRLATEVLTTSDLFAERERLAGTIDQLRPTLRDLLVSTVAERLEHVVTWAEMPAGRRGAEGPGKSIAEMVRPHRDEVEEEMDYVVSLAPKARKKLLKRYQERLSEHEAAMAEMLAMEERVREMDRQRLRGSKGGDATTDPAGRGDSPQPAERAGQESASGTERGGDPRPASPPPPPRDPWIISGPKPSFLVSL